MNDSRKANPIDRYVGNRLRTRRKIMQLSQEKLGEKVGVTFQQIQKYEKGLNRIGASTLKAIADTLDIDITYFFSEEGSSGTMLAEPDTEFTKLSAIMSARQLMENFQKIENVQLRKQILDLVNSIANDSNLLAESHKSDSEENLTEDDI